MTAADVSGRCAVAGGRAARAAASLALPALLGVGGVALALALTAGRGPGLTPDSVSYLAAARGLLDGEGLRAPDGGPFVAFPPLFPALVAASSLGVFDLVATARVVVALSFGLTVFLVGLAVWRLDVAWFWPALAAAAALLSEPLLLTALHVWSEAPFTALALAGLVALTPGPPMPSLLTAALACLTRYVGVVLPLTQAGAALVTAGRGERSRRAGLALLGLAPLALWLLRNLAVSGTLLGERHRAEAGLAENARAAAETLLRWLVPLDVAMRWRTLVVLLVVLAALGVLPAARRGWTDARRSLRPLLPFALFAALYAGYLVLSASLVAVDPIDGRLIAPLLPALVVLAAGLLGGRLGADGSGAATVGRGIAVAVVLAWLAASGADAVRLVRRVERDGAGGYGAERWTRSQTLAAVRDALPSGPLVSNDPFAVWHHTGREARLSPRRHAYRSRDRVDDLPALERAVSGGDPVYLVWFEGVPRDFLLSLPDLAAILDLEPVIRADDGAVYRVGGPRRSRTGREQGGGTAAPRGSDAD